MTANVNVQIARRTSVIRVPNAALRFRPTNEIFAALGQSPGDAAGPGGEAAGPPGNGDGPTLGRGTAPAASQTSPGSSQPWPSLPVNGEGAGAGRSAREAGRGGAGRGRGADLTSEERSRLLEAMRARGLDPAAVGSGPGDGRLPREPDTGGGKPKTAEPAVAAARGGATTIDALFGPLPEVESTGRVWIHENNRLRPVRLRLGITDGQASELLEGDLEPGMNLVTSVTTGAETTRPPMTGFPPFIGGGRGGFGGGGARGGGGNNTGRGR
jgi:HlyD family secretion protein